MDFLKAALEHWNPVNAYKKVQYAVSNPSEALNINKSQLLRPDDQFSLMMRPNPTPAPETVPWQTMFNDNQLKDMGQPPNAVAAPTVPVTPPQQPGQPVANTGQNARFGFSAWNGVR